MFRLSKWMISGCRKWPDRCVTRLFLTLGPTTIGGDSAIKLSSPCRKTNRGGISDTIGQRTHWLNGKTSRLVGRLSLRVCFQPAWNLRPSMT